MKKIIISDYDDTIVSGTEAAFYAIVPAVLGESEFERMKKLQNDPEMDWMQRYLNDNSLTREKGEEMWQNFKKTDVYRELVSVNNKKINDILSLGENMPEDGTTSFYLKSLLFPLIGLYNVYVKKFTPHEVFFELYRKSKESGDIFVINTLKNDEIIINELEQFADLYKEKCRIFKDLARDKMVFGSSSMSCKGNGDRIKFILNKLYEKNNLRENEEIEIVIMGDSGSDCDDFKEAKRIKPNSTKFLFINDRLEKIIDDLTQKANQNNLKEEQLKKLSGNLERYKGERDRLNKASIVRGSYSEVSATIYK